MHVLILVDLCHFLIVYHNQILQNYSKIVDVPADHEREAHDIVSDPALSKVR